MNRRTPIFFLLLFTLAQTELHQLLKLPVLVEHFREHLLRDPQKSFISYLVEHYRDDSDPDNDYQRDMQLPFKTADCITAISFIFVIPSSYTIERVFATTVKEYNLHPDYSAVWQNLDNIFQPPRNA